MKTLLGAHIRISKGLCKSIEIGESICCNTIQIFTKNSRQFFAKKIPQKTIEEFKAAKEKSNIKIIVAHTSYLINLCSAKKETEEKSIKSLKEELKRCENLGIKYLIMHPGSHMNQGESIGIKKISKNLDSVLSSATGKTMILLETMAGQGTNIGYKFEQLKEIRKLCKNKKLIGFCLDTCHIYSSGYNIGTKNGFKQTFKKFNTILGLENLKVIHVNNSKTNLGSKKDRHANINKGKIPLLTFKLLMQDKRFANLPKILETPTDSKMKEYIDELKLLKRLAR